MNATTNNTSVTRTWQCEVCRNGRFTGTNIEARIAGWFVTATTSLCPKHVEADDAMARSEREANWLLDSIASAIAKRAVAAKVDGATWPNVGSVNYAVAELLELATFLKAVDVDAIVMCIRCGARTDNAISGDGGSTWVCPACGDVDNDTPCPNACGSVCDACTQD